MIKIEKIADLQYNELITLRVIEQDEDLLSIFREDLKLPFSMLYRMTKEDSLTPEIKSLVSEFFEKIISTKKEYVSKYKLLMLKCEEGEDILADTKSPPVVEEVITPAEVIISPAKVKKVKTVKEEPTSNKLPRRYGKQAIEKDIAAQGGKANTTQLTAIAINDLKNIYGVLNTRMIKDMHSDVKFLTDEEYREIRAAINILKNKVNPILNKKK